MPKGRRGKTPLTELVQTQFGKSIWELFQEEFAAVDNCTDAAKKIKELSKGKLTPIPLTVRNTVRRGLEKGEIDESAHCASWKDKLAPKSYGGKRSKESIRFKVERHFGKSVWKVFHEIFKDVATLEDAAEALKKASDGKVTTCLASIKNTIVKGMEKKEIDAEDPLFILVKPKRKSKKAKDSGVPELDAPKVPIIKFLGTCKECGEKRVFPVEVPLYREGGLALRASRCSSCNLWGTFKCVGEFKGKELVEEVENYAALNPKEKEK